MCNEEEEEVRINERVGVGERVREKVQDWSEVASVETAILFISVRSLKNPCGVRHSRTVMVISLVVTSVIMI